MAPTELGGAEQGFPVVEGSAPQREVLEVGVRGTPHFQPGAHQDARQDRGQLQPAMTINIPCYPQTSSVKTLATALPGKEKLPKHPTIDKCSGLVAKHPVAHACTAFPKGC